MCCNWLGVETREAHLGEGEAHGTKSKSYKRNADTEPLFEGMLVSSLANSHCHVSAAAHRYLICQQAVDRLLKGNTQHSEKPPEVVPAGLEAGHKPHFSAAQSRGLHACHNVSTSTTIQKNPSLKNFLILDVNYTEVHGGFC